MDALALMQRLGSGQMLENLSDALSATSAEVVATGEAGTVTVTFKITTRDQGNPLVTIDETIKRSSPRSAPKGAMFYALDGGLFRDDPRQIPLEFHTVETTPSVARETAVTTIERKAI